MSKREDIVAAALDIISEQGISSLTLPVLFKRAHTGAGTFYHYFSDRDVLIDSVFEFCFDTINTALEDLWDSEEPARSQFDTAVKRLFELHIKYSKEMNFLYSFTYAHVMPDRDFCRVIPSVALLNHIIILAQNEGLVKQDVSPMMMSRAARAMLASVFTGYERGEYDITEISTLRFAESAWAAIEA